jgi:hypothetical protein
MRPAQPTILTLSSMTEKSSPKINGSIALVWRADVEDSGLAVSHE